jgi:exopolysaccharide biosynthesis polyprenyl glycosylphosphotransferase
LLPFWILIFALLGLYSSSIYEKRFNEIGRLFIGSFIGMLFVIFWDFLSVKPILPAKVIPIYGFILSFILLVIFRNIARLVRTELFVHGVGLANILVVGSTEITNELIESVHGNPGSGYKIIGLVADRDSLTKHDHIRLFDSFQEARENLKTNSIHGIVQTELYSSPDKNNEVLTFAQTHHISYRFTPGNAELFVGNIAVDLFRSSIPVIAVHQTALLGWGRIIKRLFDLTLGLIMLVIASPFMLIIAVLELLFGGGSIFFRQTRLTRFNHEFRVFKFRTQNKKYDGTTPEEAFELMGKPELAKKYRDNGDFISNDPRVTGLGKFLRKTSLDELPQLFNVVKGDISLVGPRAIIPQELDQYAKKHTILSVKSGITGLAQVSGRKNITFDERRQLDMYYVQNWSFWLDIVILLKTIRVVLQGS